MSQNLKIPGYRILQKLGQGGMADVYLGLQEKLNREVAIKVMIPSLFRDPQFSTRFVKEAQTAAQLSHPNIITIHDVGTETDYYYIVMEYLGESLHQRLQQLHQFPPQKALVIIKMIASALDYAHSKGFIHRDIKPDNIMFRSDGTVVLVDFGIARAMDSSTQLTRTGMSIGTPHYMSPEQCRGEKIDGRSDIYALGVVLFELLTGEVPYKAENTAGVIIKQIQEPVPSLPKESAYFQPLIDKMMAKSRGDRVQTGRELMLFIDALLNSQSLEFTPTMQLTRREMTSVNQMTMPTPVTPLQQPSVPDLNVYHAEDHQTYASVPRVKKEKKKNLLPAILLSVLFLGLVGVIGYLLLNKPVPVNTDPVNDLSMSEPGKSAVAVKGEPEKSAAGSPQDTQEKPQDKDLKEPIQDVGEQPPVTGDKNPVVPSDKVASDTQGALSSQVDPLKEKKPETTVKSVQTGDIPITKPVELSPDQREQRLNNLVQQIRDDLSLGEYERALKRLAEARKLGNTPRLDQLERNLKQALAARRKHDQELSAAGVRTDRISAVAPELVRSYNKQLGHIQIKLPNKNRPSVMGEVTLLLTITEKGRLMVTNFDENLQINARLLRRGNFQRLKEATKRLISNEIERIVLTPPTDSEGKPVRVEQWRVTFKVGQYLSILNLTKK